MELRTNVLELNCCIRASKCWVHYYACEPQYGEFPRLWLWRIQLQRFLFSGIPHILIYFLKVQHQFPILWYFKSSPYYVCLKTLLTLPHIIDFKNSTNSSNFLKHPFQFPILWYFKTSPYYGCLKHHPSLPHTMVFLKFPKFK